MKKKIVTVLEAVLGAGSNRRTRSTPNVRLNSGTVRLTRRPSRTSTDAGNKRS